MKHLLIIMACLVAIAASSATAELVTDYLDYGTTYDGSLTALTTDNTSGWGTNAWSGSANPRYKSDSALFTSAHGEATSYVNTNIGGKLLGLNTAGTVTRALDPALNGTVWMSIVFTSTRWNASLDLQHSRILINGTADDFLSVSSLGSPNIIRWWVNENGVATSNNIVAAGYNNYGGGLLVARLRTNYSGTDDDISMWIFTNKCDMLATRNVAGLGDALYQSSTAQDIWGDSIASLGIAIKSANTSDRQHWVDNLRISKGALTDDQHVYEILTGTVVPEPAGVLALLALGALVRRGR